jgi:hypothetical protein
MRASLSGQTVAFGKIHRRIDVGEQSGFGRMPVEALLRESAIVPQATTRARSLPTRALPSVRIVV